MKSDVDWEPVAEMLAGYEESTDVSDRLLGVTVNQHSETIQQLNELKADIKKSSEALAELTVVKAELNQHAEMTYKAFQEIQADVLSQSTLVRNVYEQTNEQKNKLNRLLQQVKGVPEQLQALADPIERLQAAQRVPGGRRQRKQESALPQLPTKTVAIVLVVQSALVAFVTALLIYQFPPAANAKSQQQWYAIFQRVDRLYQAKYGK